jgi:hypothetical protein
MNHKSVLAVFVGVAITIAGALNYFLRSPEVKETDAAIFGLIAFTAIGCAITVAVIRYHREVGGRFFLSGVSILGLTIPLTMLGFSLSSNKWYLAIAPLSAAILASGVFLVAHGVAKSRIDESTLEDASPEYMAKPVQLFRVEEPESPCETCGVEFRITCGSCPDNNGCT